MSYNQNIPQPNDRIKDSQPELLANFQAIDTLVNINHIDFDDPSGNQGKHKWVAFPNTIPPTYVPPVIPGEVTLFNTVSTDTLVNELTVITSDGREVAATASTLSLNPTPANGDGGWTFLPSGFLMWFGTTTGVINANVITTITLADISPSTITFTKILKVQLTCRNPTAVAATAVSTVMLVNIISNTQFRIKLSGPSAFVDMLIIGL